MNWIESLKKTLKNNYKMLKNNQKNITGKHDDKVGMDSNESCFWGTDRELRAHKMYIVPEHSGGGQLRMEQGWSDNASRKDMIRLTFVHDGKKKSMIFRRRDFEQTLFLFAQGDETLKYAPSGVNS